MFPAEYKIRDLTIRPAAVLAPMAGVTDTLFRRVIRGLGGCGLLMTEFTSSEGITRSAAKTLRYLYFQEDEHPITAQLFGANPSVMAEAARMVEDLGYDAVDINLGCPAKKVVKCGGSGLLRDLPLLEQIFCAVRRAVKIPVIGNGDISRPEDAERMFRETCCDAVMIGRAAASNPWIFLQMQEFAETGRYTIPTEADRFRLLIDYYRRIYAANPPDGVGKMKQFACWFTHSVGNGSELRRIVHAARTSGEILSNVESFFEGRAAALAGPSPVGAGRSEDPAYGPRQRVGCEATLGT